MCEEEGCEEQVFAVAINLLDRFLCACVIQRTQLQLLGSVCLLLASKLRQCRPLSVDNLTFYTDYSVSQQEIRVSRKPAFIRILKYNYTNIKLLRIHNYCTFTFISKLLYNLLNSLMILYPKQ